MTCQVDLLAVDDTDEYWVVCHQIVEDWQDAETFIRDEAALAACWAWEQDYLGMTIAGTIHNEVRTAGPLQLPSDSARGVRGPSPSMSPAAGADQSRSTNGCRHEHRVLPVRAEQSNGPRAFCAERVSGEPVTR